MRPLKDVLPPNANNVLNVFYDFDTTQNKRYFDKAKKCAESRLRENVLCEL